MVHVLPETAQYLFRAQFPQHRGRLRLDISSRRFPADPRRRLDVACAVEAIGERVVGLLVGCALDARLLREASIAGASNSPCPDSNIPVGAEQLPLPDQNNRIRIMPNRLEFEGFVVDRLDRDFGLDELSAAHDKAITYLARDFHGWVVREPESSEHWFYHWNGEIFVLCKSYVDKDTLSDLEPAEDFTMDRYPEGTECSARRRV